MSSDSEVVAQRPGDGAEDKSIPDEPSTPLDGDVIAPSSQASLPSTEGPGSPIDASESFKTELNDDRNPTSSSIIPSSLTPPPSSQMPVSGNAPSAFGYISSQRSAILSPPVTGLNTNVKRELTLSEFTPPSPSRVVEAPPEELRAMLQACIAEHAKLKTEAAHHKFQYNLLSLQADEEAKRAAVEHEMTRREVEALRTAEHSRQARRELSAATDSAHAKYLQLRSCYEELLEENEILRKRLRSAKKVIQQKEEKIVDLKEEKEELLNRLRENREHFRVLCSPGGMFHGALTPQGKAVSTPVQHRATPRQTPRSGPRESRHPDRDHGQESFAALLQAIRQENNSAPSTPTTSHRPDPRAAARHVRNVQSMSSLPTTPTARPRGEYAGLLPSVEFVPQTEPPQRYGGRLIPETPVRGPEPGRKSRESTISADDNEELARQALVSVAARTESFITQVSHRSRGPRHPADEEEEEEVFESQASQAASAMLRRDPRESFEVASSIGDSRDGTPTPTDKGPTKLQAKIIAGLNKSGIASEKRKFGGGMDALDDARREVLISPTKKARVAGGLREDSRRVGLGIQYGQES